MWSNDTEPLSHRQPHAFELRLVLCASCRAPLEAALLARAVACSYCGHDNPIPGQRPQVPLRFLPRRSEQERLALLREQLGRKLRLSNDLKHLLDTDTTLLPFRAAEAGAIWNAVRDQVALAPNAAQIERFFALTFLLAAHFVKERELVQYRALYEGALEATSHTPEFQQVMLGQLARRAAIEGELEAAESWLKLCDPQASDIAADTMYRLARAGIDTAHGRFQAVISVLGQHPDDVPIYHPMRPFASVYHANALEHLGHLDQARQQIVDLVQTIGANRVEDILTAHSRWGLCEKSFDKRASGRKPTLSHFTRVIRVSPCAHCGAPIELPTGSASCRCTYCGVVNSVPIRPLEERLKFTSAPLPEADRLARLRQQVDYIYEVPEDLRYLPTRGDLALSQVEAVMARWQEARIAAQRSTSPEPADLLVQLTLLLTNYYAKRKNWLLARSLFEGALEACSLPRHRQVCIGNLCRAACRAGDLKSAFDWLSLADPRPDDLSSDSAYRISVAHLETARGSYEVVLDVLGAKPDQIPCDYTMKTQQGVLRANAQEKLGRVELAYRLLRDVPSDLVPSETGAPFYVIRNNPHLALCPQAGPRLLRRRKIGCLIGALVMCALAVAIAAVVALVLR